MLLDELVLCSCGPETVLFSSSDCDDDDARLCGDVGLFICRDRDVLHELGAEFELSWSSVCIDELLLDKLVDLLVETTAVSPSEGSASTVTFFEESLDELLLFELELCFRLGNPIAMIIPVLYNYFELVNLSCIIRLLAYILSFPLASVISISTLQYSDLLDRIHLRALSLLLSFSV